MIANLGVGTPVHEQGNACMHEIPTSPSRLWKHLPHNGFTEGLPPLFLPHLGGNLIPVQIRIILVPSQLIGTGGVQEGFENSAGCLDRLGMPHSESIQVYIPGKTGHMERDVLPSSNGNLQNRPHPDYSNHSCSWFPARGSR
jgi:hypothetical protein